MGAVVNSVTVVDLNRTVNDRGSLDYARQGSRFNGQFAVAQQEMVRKRRHSQREIRPPASRPGRIQLFLHLERSVAGGDDGKKAVSGGAEVNDAGAFGRIRHSISASSSRWAQPTGCNCYFFTRSSGYKTPLPLNSLSWWGWDGHQEH